MENLEELARILESLDGKGYGTYKRIRGRWQGPELVLSVDHVQGDPFAAPTRVSVHLAPGEARLPARIRLTDAGRTGVAAWLARDFHDNAGGSHGRGSGKSGLVAMTSPGQLVLPQTAVHIDADGAVEARIVVGLPARGRRIMGSEAARILTRVVPGLVDRHLRGDAHPGETLIRAAEVNEDADALRSGLEARDLVAFVGDGAVLPRESGVSDRPLASGAVPFESPASLRVTLDTPNDGPVTGMGVPRGVTLIAGGGFHGKSTLLRALEAGVYNHRPGDGRERVVTRADAVKIRAEDGRAVTGVDISSFIDDLPDGRATTSFDTRNASGSTSQAAALVESVELGASLLLMDEDTCATNFLIRDRRMQALIRSGLEPITPLVDRVRALERELGVSTVLVLGGSGDYLDVADTVVAMERYRPLDRTADARKVAEAHPTGRLRESTRPLAGPLRRRLGSGSLPRDRKGRDLRVRVLDEGALRVGPERLDLAAVEQLPLRSQLNTVAAVLEFMDRETGWTGTSLVDWVHTVSERLRVDAHGVDGRRRGDLAYVRPQELGAALNRLRTLQLAES